MTQADEDSLYFEESRDDDLQPHGSGSQNDLMDEEATPTAVPSTTCNTIFYPVQIGKFLRLHNCIMNASGVNSGNQTELAQLDMQMECGAIVTKSSTIHPRPGKSLFMVSRSSQPATTMMQNDHLANLGIEAYMNVALHRRLVGKYHRPFIISVQGRSPGELLFQIRRCINFNKQHKCRPIDGIEVNTATKFIEGEHLLGYDTRAMVAFLEHLVNIDGSDKIPIGLKLPPYYEQTQIQAVASCILEANRQKPHVIDFITCVYSLGNSLALDVKNDRPILPVSGGFGGLCGYCIKPVGVGNVHMFRQHLGDAVGIIGAGGICTGQDVYEYLLAGADAVQIGSSIQISGLKKGFEKIHMEFHEHMRSKGVQDPTAIRRRLRPHPLLVFQ